MSTLRTAAQQALEAMHSFEWSKNGLYAGEFETEIAALRKALAEQNPDSKHSTIAEWRADKHRKPLTEEEIELAYRQIWRDLPSDFDHTSSGWIEQGIKYAEQAHGIKDA